MSVQHTTAGWGRALTHVLTEAAGDATILEAGHHLLATNTAGPLNINQGFATTKFPLTDGRVARPRLLATELTAQQWDHIEDAIAKRPDATQLAGTALISDQLTDPARTAGIPLVPTPQDLSFTCTCLPDTASPCAHSIALGLLLAHRLRTAPAPLFTLRGRPHQHLKTRLRTTTTPAGHPDADVPARVLAPDVAVPPQRETSPPAADSLPAHAARPASPIPDPVDLDLAGLRLVPTSRLAPAPPPLPDGETLQALVADAAHRAGLLLDGDEPPACPDTGSDLARFVALPHGAPFRQAAMEHLGLGIVAMGHLQLAHTYGGPGGAAAYLEPFTVDRDVLAHAQAAIQPLRPAPLATVVCADNHLTDEAAGIQLRYGPDGNWHPYRAPYGNWQPVPGSNADPAQAYRAARRAARTERRTA
ncbi:hypothetical protein QMK19_23350 [Streptomyces sp. H10-C2]|uniref:hypothetical protein n=1 Tax=unclassified Streptomyces TaxID=2593676 RepID=UPI0024B97E6D|nr:MULTISPECIES: hypothetical protein [unclassified Streptomyces]MDJ0342844.1 hypothetical protein [Streptomyces sp. PH10-H1]MDJ0372522.1 hypothetical protein [Streptomyces sp. H10-C2]